MKNLVKRLAPLIDLIALPFVAGGGLVLMLARRLGLMRLPLCKRILLTIGIFPLRDHYYEPLFNPRWLRYPLDEPRLLPGVDLSEAGQLKLLEQMAVGNYGVELNDLIMGRTDSLKFHFNNGAFESGDAEFWYAMIRHFKPRKIIEIGSGNSTLMARRAIEQNSKIDPAYCCAHTCIEPYEMAWLEQCGVEVIRERVEQVAPDFFRALGSGDILFIDSSHMIRPQGDVLYEFLRILPILASGVIVHVHDIFTPRDYPRQWVVEENKFWNEQYLLEAFLCHNADWQVLAALNFLHHSHSPGLKDICPYLEEQREPGSFYLQKRSRACVDTDDITARINPNVR